MHGGGDRAQQDDNKRDLPLRKQESVKKGLTVEIPMQKSPSKLDTGWNCQYYGQLDPSFYGEQDSFSGLLSNQVDTGEESSKSLNQPNLQTFEVKRQSKFFPHPLLPWFSGERPPSPTSPWIPQLPSSPDHPDSAKQPRHSDSFSRNGVPNTSFSDEMTIGSARPLVENSSKRESNTPSSFGLLPHRTSTTEKLGSSTQGRLRKTVNKMISIRL